MRLEIQVRNGKVKITALDREVQPGGSNSVPSGVGGDDPLDTSSSSGSGEPSAGSGCCCCAPTVIGPIVVPACCTPDDTGGDDPLDASSSSGSGEPSAGSGCCCAPTVIGPIVFTGCCSGQAAASPDSGGVRQVTVNPSPSLYSTSAARAGKHFKMEQQKQTNWCWAAVAVSVHNFLDPAGQLYQAPVATDVLGAGLDCTMPLQAASTTQCNQSEPLTAALNQTKNLQEYLPNSYLSFQCLQNWSNARIPVCARIVWYGGGAHFIALLGAMVLASGQKRVHVHDPAPPAPPNAQRVTYTAPSVWDYDALVNHYHTKGVRGVWGSWHDSYLVTP